MDEAKVRKYIQDQATIESIKDRYDTNLSNPFQGCTYDWENNKKEIETQANLEHFNILGRTNKVPLEGCRYQCPFRAIQATGEAGGYDLAPSIAAPSGGSAAVTIIFQPKFGLTGKFVSFHQNHFFDC